MEGGISSLASSRCLKRSLFPWVSQVSGSSLRCLSLFFFRSPPQGSPQGSLCAPGPQSLQQPRALSLDLRTSLGLSPPTWQSLCIPGGFLLTAKLP